MSSYLVAELNDCLLRTASAPPIRVARREPNPCPLPKAPPKRAPALQQKPAHAAAITKLKGHWQCSMRLCFNPALLRYHCPGYLGLLERKRAKHWLNKTYDTLRSLPL